MRFIKGGPKSEADFRYTNLFLASDRPPPSPGGGCFGQSAIALHSPRTTQVKRCGMRVAWEQRCYDPPESLRDPSLRQCILFATVVQHDLRQLEPKGVAV